MPVDCKGGDCVDSGTNNGLPYLILIITMVLCSILLATLAILIVVIVTRNRRKRMDSLDTAISYDDLVKPGLTTMEVQPDLRALELRGDNRAFVPFSPLTSRRFGPQGQFDAQRRLIPVPEEEGSADEGRQAKVDLFNFPPYDYNNGNLGDAEGEGDAEADDDILEGTSAATMRQVRQIPHSRDQHRTPSNSGT
ncbi:hypothetical protein BsWGS_08733 [Bradybaena similaris]